MAIMCMVVRFTGMLSRYMCIARSRCEMVYEVFDRYCESNIVGEPFDSLCGRGIVSMVVLRLMFEKWMSLIFALHHCQNAQYMQLMTSIECRVL